MTDCDSVANSGFDPISVALYTVASAYESIVESESESVADSHSDFDSDSDPESVDESDSEYVCKSVTDSDFVIGTDPQSIVFSV